MKRLILALVLAGGLTFGGYATAGGPPPAKQGVQQKGGAKKGGKKKGPGKGAPKKGGAKKGGKGGR